MTTSYTKIKNEDDQNLLNIGEVTLHRGESQEIGNFIDLELKPANDNLPVQFSVHNLSEKFIVYLEFSSSVGKMANLPYYFSPSIQPKGIQFFILNPHEKATIRSIPDYEAPPPPKNLRIEIFKAGTSVLTLNLFWDFPYMQVPSDFLGFAIYEDCWFKKQKLLQRRELTMGHPIQNNYFQLQIYEPSDSNYSYVYGITSVDKTMNQSRCSNLVAIKKSWLGEVKIVCL